MPKLQGLLPTDTEYLVVWDGPDDGTERFCLDSGITATRGPGDGLGAAILRGIELASHDRIIVMDGDGQHPVTAVRQIMADLQSGAPLVFGCRALKTHTTLPRELIGLFMRALARPLTGISDPMTGLFGLDRRQVDLSNVKGNGWKVALELATMNRHLDFEEVAFCFRERLAGESKATFKTGVKYAWQVISLAWRHPVTHDTLVKAGKFGLVGLSGVAVNMGVFEGLYMAGMQYNAAAILGFQAAVCWNYAFNKLWTFKDVPTPWMDGFWKFAVVALAALTVKQGVLTGVVEGAGISVHVGVLVGIAAASAVNFIGSKLWAFRPKLSGGSVENVTATGRAAPGDTANRPEAHRA